MGRVVLALQAEKAGGRRLPRRVDRAAGCKELVQPEGEYRLSGLGAQAVAQRQKASGFSEQAATGSPLASLNLPTPSANVMGRRRMSRLSSSSTLKVSSTHAASGSPEKAEDVSAGSGASTAARSPSAVVGDGTWMARRRVSSTTFSGGTATPKSFVATSAAACLRAARSPSLATVALVPTCSMRGFPARSRRRRSIQPIGRSLGGRGVDDGTCH